MADGFVVGTIIPLYYCSKKCRDSEMTEEEYEERYHEGEAYWTEFQDDMQD